MRTLVSPIFSATLAMPLARFCMERHAWEEREARLSIVDDAEVDGGGLRREVRWARIGPFLFDPHLPSCSGPVPTSNRSVPIFPVKIKSGVCNLCDCNWAQVRKNDLLCSRSLR